MTYQNSTKLSYNIEDGVAYLGFLFAALLSFSWLDAPAMIEWLNFVLIEVQSPLGTSVYTFPMLIMWAAVGVVLYTNDIDLSSLSLIQGVLLLLMVWITVSPPFVPLMYELTTSMQLASIIAFTVQSFVFNMIGYLG